MLSWILLGFAPGLFWLWYFRRKDDLEPEPHHLLLWVFALGCGSAFLIVAFRQVWQPLVPSAPGWGRDAVDAFLATALFEELVKLLAFFAGAFFHKELDEPLDGLIYGIAAGLGFASVENVFYVMATGQALTVALRACTAVLVHAVCSGGAGFFLGLSRFTAGRRRWILPLAGFALAVALHGAYDVFLFREGGERFLALLVVLPAALVLFGLKFRWARARSPEYHARRITGR